MPEAFYGLLIVAAALAAWAAVRFFRRGSTQPAGPERRTEPRIETPSDCGQVSVGGVPYPLRNWSAQGFLAIPYTGNLGVGDKCVVNIHVQQEPFDIAFAAEAVIVRKSAGELAGRFVFLPPEGKGLMDAYFAYHTQMR
jgi:hypothetical protein